jgi:hypothetical protein
MEENDLKELLEYMREELKDDFFAQKFFVSLVNNNIFYNIENDIIYTSFNISVLGVSIILSQYRVRKFFKDDDKYAYMRFFKLNSKELEMDSVKGFIILKNNMENIEYIRSISRDNKLKKIIDERK